MGYDGVEIDLGRPEILPVNGIKRKMRETGVKCTFSVGLASDKNVTSLDYETRKRGVEYVKKLINIASDLESDVICGILYAAWGELSPEGRKPEKFELARRCVLEMADYARDHGVLLALEPVNRFEGYLINSVEEMIGFIEMVNHPSVGITLDTFHMNIEEDDFYKSFKMAGRLLYHVHLSENHRGIPGTGHIPWRDVFKVLKELNYDRWAVVEAWDMNVLLSELGEIPPKIAMWRQLAPNGDILAERAIKFFKEIERSL